MRISGFLLWATKILCLTGIVLACTKEPDCEVGTPPSTISVKFYSKLDSSELYIKFLTVRAIGSDSTFYMFPDSLSTYDLQLNTKEEQSTYLFVSSTLTDTVSVRYFREMEWLSEECGPSFRLSELELVHSTFLSELISPFIDNSINENIKIYN